MTHPADADRPAVQADAERDLIGHLRRQASAVSERRGWAYSSLAALLLVHGRLFTPSRWADSVAPPGEPGRCYVESVSWAWASSGTLAYVEGLACSAGGAMVEHAWCADVLDGRARDLTWSEPGRAYLGLPVDAEHAAGVMGARAGPLLYGVVQGVSDVAERWMRSGIPEGLLLDVGRAVPD
ncbi:hypothetical protein [Streptomyces sp. NPDC001297]|uniref:hypothetical protein n=1 Tax=Streptomyces sp. NPDC001297 TaxID=3364559 RepID=UPI003684E2D5